MSRFAYTLFCDDIRREVGGKFTYVGVYGAGLLLPRLPAILPKLCLAITVVTPVDEPIRTLAFQVTRDSQGVIARGELADAETMLPAPPKGEARFARVMAQVVFSPLQLDAIDTIRVSVIVDDDELDAGTLTIAQHAAAPAAPVGDDGPR